MHKRRKKKKKYFVLFVPFCGYFLIPNSGWPNSTGCPFST